LPFRSGFGLPHRAGRGTTRLARTGARPAERLPARWAAGPPAGTMSAMNPSLLNLHHAKAIRAEQTRRRRDRKR